MYVLKSKYTVFYEYNNTIMYLIGLPSLFLHCSVRSVNWSPRNVKPELFRINPIQKMRNVTLMMLRHFIANPSVRLDWPCKALMLWPSFSLHVPTLPLKAQDQKRICSVFSCLRCAVWLLSRRSLLNHNQTGTAHNALDSEKMELWESLTVCLNCPNGQNQCFFSN